MKNIKIGWLYAVIAVLVVAIIVVAGLLVKNTHSCEDHDSKEVDKRSINNESREASDNDDNAAAGVEPCDYYAEPFSEGMAKVKKDGKEGYVDSSGEFKPSE